NKNGIVFRPASRVRNAFVDLDHRMSVFLNRETPRARCNVLRQEMKDAPDTALLGCFATFQSPVLCAPQQDSKMVGAGIGNAQLTTWIAESRIFQVCNRLRSIKR